MAAVVSGDPERLERYTRVTEPTIPPACRAVNAAVAAVAAFNHAPNDLGGRVPAELAGRALGPLWALAVLDDQPEAFAWALRQADSGSGVGAVVFGDPELFAALVNARMANRNGSDAELLAQALAPCGMTPEEAAIFAAMLATTSDRGCATQLREFLFGDLGNFWAGDDGIGPGRAAAALLRTMRAPGFILAFLTGRLPPAPTSMNGLLAIRLGKVWPAFEAFRNSNLVAGLRGARAESLLARGQSLRSLPARAGLARSLGVVGGVYSTASGVADLVGQGDPRQAFQERGTEYAADVAETAFSASSTAFFVAPNPVTAGATLVTGAAWLGLEAWNHREDIARTTSTAWRVTTDVAGDLWDGASDGAAAVAGALNPFD